MGEEVYKSKPRVFRYGMEAYAKMRGFKGKRALKEVERLKKLYPTAPFRLEPKAPFITRSMRSYWKDVKALAKARDIGTKASRKILKRLKTDKNVQVRVIKSGEGFQLVMFGLYENIDKENIYYRQREEATGHSYVHEEQDYDECLGECIAEAQSVLGGSGWELVKVIKETWIRYFGREEYAL